MAQRIIGLDVGTWSVKAAVLESSLRRAQLVDFREHHIPADPRGEPIEGELVASISATLRGVEQDAVVAAVPGTYVLTRELELPFSDPKRIQSVLGFQLESVLPKQLEDVVYDFEVIRETEGGAQLLCPAVDRARLVDWLATLKAGGADPRLVTATSLTASHALEHLDIEQGERVIAIVDLGHRTTDVSVVRDGRVEAIRTISRGGHQLTVALMRGLDADYGQAEHIKHTGVRFDGYLPEGLDEQSHAERAKLVAKALEPVLREIRMTLHAHADRIGRAVDEVILCGGSARLPGISELMERVLDVPVSIPRPRGALWEGLTGVDVPTVALTATSLALRNVADGSRHHVNFRQGELAYESDFRVFRSKFIWLGVFAFVLVALFFGRKYFQMKTLEQQQAELAEQLDDFTDRLLGTTFSAGDEPLEKFEMVREAVLNPPEAGGTELYPTMTAFKIFYDVSEILAAFNEDAAPVEKAAAPAEDEDAKDEDAKSEEPETKRIELESATVDVKNVTQEFQTATVTGAGYDVVTIEGFRKQLAQHACFDKVEQQGDTKNVRFGRREGWKEFTLKIEVKCGKDDAEPVADADGTGEPREED